jgi:hypothetical protein
LRKAIGDSKSDLDLKFAREKEVESFYSAIIQSGIELDSIMSLLIQAVGFGEMKESFRYEREYKEFRENMNRFNNSKAPETIILRELSLPKKYQEETDAKAPTIILRELKLNNDNPIQNNETPRTRSSFIDRIPDEEEKKRLEQIDIDEMSKIREEAEIDKPKRFKKVTQWNSDKMQMERVKKEVKEKKDKKSSNVSSVKAILRSKSPDKKEDSSVKK